MKAIRLQNKQVIKLKGPIRSETIQKLIDLGFIVILAGTK